MFASGSDTHEKILFSLECMTDRCVLLPKCVQLHELHFRFLNIEIISSYAEPLQALPQKILYILSKQVHNLHILDLIY